MAQILYLPKPIPLSTTGGLMSGAKLYTYLTGTSTPQAVYSDYTLTTPHANPVVADANGVFPAIYWDNSARYRLTLKTSADVTMAGYPVDDCGPDTLDGLGAASIDGANVFTGATNKFSAAEVRLLLDETDGGTDKRLWDIDIQAGVLSLRTRTDADGSGKDILKVLRGSTTVVTSMTYGDVNDAVLHDFYGNMRVEKGATGSPAYGFNNSSTGNTSGMYFSTSLGKGTQFCCNGLDGLGIDTSGNVAVTNGKVFLGVDTGTSVPFIRVGTGSPETVVTAVVGSLFLRTDGGASTTLYVKESGTSNTGWVAK